MQLSASSPTSHVVDSIILAQSCNNDCRDVARTLCFMSHSLLSGPTPSYGCLRQITQLKARPDLRDRTWMSGVSR